MTEEGYELDLKGVQPDEERLVQNETVIDEKPHRSSYLLQSSLYQYHGPEKFETSVTEMVGVTENNAKTSRVALIKVGRTSESEDENDDAISSHPKLAALAFLVCCPLGALAVVKSIQVKIAVRKNDYEAAEKAAEWTRIFSAMSIICGVITMCMLAAIFLGSAADV